MLFITKFLKEENNLDIWQIEVITLINKDLKDKKIFHLHSNLFCIARGPKLNLSAQFCKWRLFHFDTQAPQFIKSEICSKTA